MKVLVVDPDAVRAATLQLALATHGAEVTVAASGSFALTMLEWNRHGVVASRARIDDMDGHELCAILKSDPSTRDVRFVLIAGPTEVTAAQTTAAGVDLLLPPTLDAASVVPHVMRLVNGDASPAPAPPAPVTPAPAPAAAAPAPSPAPVVAASPAPVAAPRPLPPPRPVPPPVTPAPAPAAPRVPPPPAKPAPAPVAAPAPAPVAAPVPPAVAPAAVAPPAASPVPPAPAAPPTPAAPAPPPAVPKLRPDPVTAPTAEPPKRYVTAAAAAAAAPWTKQAAAPAATPAPAAPAAPAINLDQMPSGTFQGSLEVMDLADLTQALAMGGKNGRLILALPQGGGVIAFEAGRVTHAEFRGTVGEPAFVALLTTAHAGGAGRFCFLPSGPGEKPSPVHTIAKGLDQLLLSIATAIDEKG